VVVIVVAGDLVWPQQLQQLVPDGPGCCRRVGSIVEDEALPGGRTLPAGARLHLDRTVVTTRGDTPHPAGGTKSREIVIIAGWTLTAERVGVAYIRNDASARC